MTIQSTASIWNTYRQLGIERNMDDPAGQAIRDKMRRQISELTASMQSTGDVRKKAAAVWAA